MSSSGVSGGAELRIVCGPTAAGKSAIALALADRHGLTIVSADSRQIYRGFDVGTAKAGLDDRARVPHCGIDIADPAERWSAARWAADAGGWLRDAGAERALVVGGTGFYLRALVTPLFAAPPLDPVRRAALAEELDVLTTPALRTWVRTLDPERAHLGRAQLLRAAEIALLTGQRLSDLHREEPPAITRRARWLVVDPGARLGEQIGHRLDHMLANGWVEEVRTLETSVSPEAPAWQACGYEQVRELAHGTIGITAARDAILIGTRQYAKRQRTWFRNQIAGARVTRVDPHDARCDALVEAWWNAGESE